MNSRPHPFPLPMGEGTHGLYCAVKLTVVFVSAAYESSSATTVSACGPAGMLTSASIAPPCTTRYLFPSAQTCSWLTCTGLAALATTCTGVITVDPSTGVGMLTFTDGVAATVTVAGAEIEFRIDGCPTASTNSFHVPAGSLPVKSSVRAAAPTLLASTARFAP